MRRWIHSSTYGYSILIHVGKWKSLRRHVRRKYKLDIGEQIHGGGSHICIGSDTSPGRDFSVVWLPEWSPDDWRDIRILSHELLHAAMRCLDIVGVEFSIEHQEALCYLHEDFCRSAHNELDR